MITGLSQRHSHIACWLRILGWCRDSTMNHTINADKGKLCARAVGVEPVEALNQAGKDAAVEHEPALTLG